MKKVINLVKAFVTVLTFIVTICFLPKASAYDVKLGWDASVSPNVGGYEVFWGNASGTYTGILDVGNVTTATVPDLANETLYFFAVKAYNTDKSTRSGFSNEISMTTPPIIIVPPLPLFSSVKTGYTVDVTPVKVPGATKWVWIAEGSTQGTVTRTVGTKLRLHYDDAGTYPVNLEITTPDGVKQDQQQVEVGPK